MQAEQHDGPYLLSQVELLPGASQSSSDPNGGEFADPAAQSIATPNLVDDPEWWTVPGQPAGRGRRRLDPRGSTRDDALRSGCAPGGGHRLVELHRPTGASAAAPARRS
jgi:hypothetical protein